MSARILVVDDWEPLRRLVCSILSEAPGLEVICEVSDGQEAVEKAQELHPDLILLDVGLPILNGLEAAKRIERVAPGAKILFLTQENDPDVARAALNNGAKGYVLKADAGRELLRALEVVLQGDRFLSSRLKTSDDALAEPTLATLPQ